MIPESYFHDSRTIVRDVRIILNPKDKVFGGLGTWNEVRTTSAPSRPRGPGPSKYMGSYVTDNMISEA